MQSPIIVGISRLHRQTSAVIEEAAKSDRPVFVLQYTFVAAVLLPRSMYDRLLRAAEKGAAGRAPRALAPPEDRDDRGAPSHAGDLAAPSHAGEPPEHAYPVDPLNPLAVFGPLPPGTRFRTEKGYSIDAELAAFFMEEGDKVTPIIEPPDEDWRHDESYRDDEP
jgi:hypothetical protein